MQIRQLAVADSFEITPQVFLDDRGAFFEWYRFDKLESAVGHTLDLRQANASVSRRGVIRGIHFADVPPGQAKYVTAMHGSIIDFIVDIRVGSPTFGQWDSVVLDDVDRKAVYVGEGLGHAFVATSEYATVNYLVSDVYRPGAEHGVSPSDPEIGLKFPDDIGTLIFSEKDQAAPTLQQALEAGILPTWSNVRAHYDLLNNDMEAE